MTDGSDAVLLGRVVQRLGDHVKRSGRFDRFLAHEPLHAPGKGVTGCVWLDRVETITRSGMAATSGVIVMTMRAYHPLTQSGPQADVVDPQLLAATSRVCSTLQGGFTLDGLLRCVDILGGESGIALRSDAGYVDIDHVLHRIITTTVPCVVNDLWPQEA